MWSVSRGYRLLGLLTIAAVVLMAAGKRFGGLAEPAALVAGLLATLGPACCVTTGQDGDERLSEELSTAGLSLVGLGLSVMALVPPIVYSSWKERAQWNAEPEIAAIVGVAVVALALVAGLRALAGPGIRAILRGSRWLPWAAALAVAASSLGAAISFACSPAPLDYLRSLPVVTVAPTAQPSALQTPHDGYAHRVEGGRDVFEVALSEGALLRHVCESTRGCSSYIGTGSLPAHVGLVGCSTGREPITIRRDEPRDIWILGEGWWGCAYWGPSLTPRPIHRSDVGSRIPLPFISTSGVGLLLSLFHLYRRSRAVKEWSNIHRAQEGLVRARWLQVEGEADGHRVDDGWPEEGPVIVFGLERPSPYRGQGAAPTLMVPGRKAETLERLRNRAAQCSARAIAVLIVSSMPLVAAIVYAVVG